MVSGPCLDRKVVFLISKACEHQYFPASRGVFSFAFAGLLSTGKETSAIDLFADTAAILNSIVSNSYYGMPRGQIHINLPPGHPIMSFETIEIKMAAVSAKRSMGRNMAEVSFPVLGSQANAKEKKTLLEGNTSTFAHM